MSGGTLRSILGKLLPNLIKVASPILKNVALPLGLSAAISGIDGAIKKKYMVLEQLQYFLMKRLMI